LLFFAGAAVAIVDRSLSSAPSRPYGILDAVAGPGCPKSGFAPPLRWREPLPIQGRAPNPQFS
jgi:hypothetical protein